MTPRASRLSPLVLAAVIGAPTACPAESELEHRQTARLVPVVISLKVNDRQVSAQGNGVCLYKPSHAQHGGESWTVNYSGVRGSNVTTFAMSVNRPQGRSRTDATITVGGSGKTRRIVLRDQHSSGSGTVGVERAGAGYRFILDVKDRDGIPVKGTVACHRLSPPR